MQSVTPLCLLATLMCAVVTCAPQYQLDPNKLQQRYDIIMGIVSAGGHQLKPQIGHGLHKQHNPYGIHHQPNPYQNPYQPQPVVYNPYAQQVKPAAHASYQVYGAPQHNQLLTPQQLPHQHHYQKQHHQQQHHQQQQHYQKPYSGYPAPYGYSASYAPGQPQTPGSSPYTNALKGLRLGGGHVHPVFNNDHLYVNTNPFGIDDPIYINRGGSSSSSSGISSNIPTAAAAAAQPAAAAAALPRASLYPTGPAGSAATAAVAAAGNAAAGVPQPAGPGANPLINANQAPGGKAAYTANPQGLYAGLPGYTQAFFQG